MMGLQVPRTRDFIVLSVFLGVVHQAAGYILVYWAEQHISSALTAVLFSTMPFAVALFARALIGDPLTPRKLIGAVSGMVGVVLVYADSLGTGGTMAATGVAAVLTAVLTASLSSVVVKKYAQHYHPLIMLLYPILVGGIIVSALAASIEQSNPMTYNSATWGSIVYLAAIGSAGGFTLFYWVVKRVDVTVVSYQTFIIPIIAVVLGRVFLGETLSGKVGIGAVFILGGITVATIRPRRKQNEQ